MGTYFDASSTISGDAIAREIEKSGYAEVKNFVNDSKLMQAQQWVENTLSVTKSSYFGCNGPEELTGTFLRDLGDDFNFKSLCVDVYEATRKLPAPEVRFYQVLRCLTADSAAGHALRFHFDSYILTVLIPIIMPRMGSPGRLLIHPNTRPVRSTYLANLIDKLLVDNSISQRLLRIGAYKLSKRVKYLELTPGSAYFFWGYRSLHTNEPCSGGAVRATALFHYADPHHDSIIKSILRRR